jgi:hypothetical protein
MFDQAHPRTLSIPKVFMENPFDAWYDFTERFTGNDIDQFARHVLYTSYPRTEHSDPAIHALIVTERLRLQGLTSDPEIMDTFWCFADELLMDIQIFMEILEEEGVPEQDNENWFFLVLHERHESLVRLFCRYIQHILHRVEHRIDNNALDGITQGPAETRGKRLALAMAFHRRLGSGSILSTIPDDILARHILTQVEPLQIFITTDEEVYPASDDEGENPYQLPPGCIPWTQFIPHNAVEDDEVPFSPIVLDPPDEDDFDVFRERPDEHRMSLDWGEW